MTKLSDARRKLVFAQMDYDEQIIKELKKALKDGVENFKPTPALIEEGWEEITVTDDHMNEKTRWIFCDVKAGGMFAKTTCDSYRINENLYVFASFNN